MSEKTLEKTLSLSIILVIVAFIIQIITVFLEKGKLTLTHLGSGTLKTGPTEEIIFEYSRTEPFTLSGYINLRNMEEGDTMVLREYVKLAVDEEYVLYAEQTYVGKQEQPLVRIRKLPAMRGVKITLRQTSGTPKYVPWEFYAGFVG
mgnify:CR=1 FL=1